MSERELRLPQFGFNREPDVEVLKRIDPVSKNSVYYIASKYGSESVCITQKEFDIIFEKMKKIKEGEA